MHNVRWMAGLLLSILFFSCHKNTGKDIEKPVLSVVAPVQNDTVNLTAGDELHLEFTLNDNQGLHYLEIKLTDQLGVEYFSATPKVTDLKVYPFHTHLTPSLNGVKNMTLNISAQDHAMNSLTTQIQFVVLP